MTRLRIKVCGMREPGNILDVSKLQPDFMGFIFYRNSPRFVGEDFILPVTFPSTTKKVGVFVNESTEIIVQKIRKYHLQFVQLHGNESRDQCKQLKEEGVGIIKVFSIEHDTDFRDTEQFVDVADYFLFDTKGKLYGGNARRFNWELLSHYQGEVPFFLSGGIAYEHVAELKQLTHPGLFAIDVNSGVELSPALKDVNKINAITAMLNN